jgi:hypothetical protein
MPSPSAEQLAYVVTHGELLSLLSLQRLEAMLDASPAPPPPTADELAAAEAAVRAELQRQERLWLEQPADGAPADADASIVMPAALPSADNAAVDIRSRPRWPRPMPTFRAAPRRCKASTPRASCLRWPLWLHRRRRCPR